MTKIIKYLLLSLFITTALAILFICNFKLEITNACQLITTEENSTFIANKKLHKYLNEENVYKCSIKFDERWCYGYFQYKEKQNDNYLYWISFELTLSIENGMYLANIHFNSLTIIKYLYYFGIN